MWSAKWYSDLAFDFGANAAGLTSANVECRQLGQICFVAGIIVPNQAGTPLTLARLSVRPKYKVSFLITGYAKVASFGLLDLDGMLLCNIPTAMMNEQCIINFAYIAADWSFNPSSRTVIHNRTGWESKAVCHNSAINVRIFISNSQATSCCMRNSLNRKSVRKRKEPCFYGLFGLFRNEWDVVAIYLP